MRHDRAPDDTPMNDVAAATAKHRIPVIDRMMDVLALLERRNDDASIRELVELLDLPRTPVFPTFNRLRLHGRLRRPPGAAYRRGRGLLGVAARGAAAIGAVDLPVLAWPHLERLSAATGEACKVSVIDDG